MREKKGRILAFLVGIAVAVPALAAPAGPAPAASAAVAQAAQAATAMTIDVATLAELLKRTALAGCTGGSCATANNNALNCPTSGGPTCGESTVCSCVCAHVTNGGWAAVNLCEAS